MYYEIQKRYSWICLICLYFDLEEIYKIYTEYMLKSSNSYTFQSCLFPDMKKHRKPTNVVSMILNCETNISLHDKWLSYNCSQYFINGLQNRFLRKYSGLLIKKCFHMKNIFCWKTSRKTVKEYYWIKFCTVWQRNVFLNQHNCQFCISSLQTRSKKSENTTILINIIINYSKWQVI